MPWLSKCMELLGISCLMGMQNNTADVENSGIFFLKDTPTLPSNSILKYLPKRNKNIQPHKDVHMNIHRNFIEQTKP